MKLAFLRWNSLHRLTQPAASDLLALVLAFRTVIGPLFLTIFLLHLDPVYAQKQDERNDRPLMGWSSWSQESHLGESWLTEAQILTQSDALRSSGLQQHGWRYINIDSGWQNGYDSYGRPTPDLTKFPNGLAAVVEHIHRNGQKAGIYWTPGVPKEIEASNPPILRTPYNVQDILVVPLTNGNGFRSSYKIDFSKPGAQEYVDSVVGLFASWGFDFIKLDGTTPGSSLPSFTPPGGGAPPPDPDPENLQIDNRADVKAWHDAIEKTNRPILLALSWSLDHGYASWWEKYSNSRRIEFDVECYQCQSTISSWSNVALRFTDLVVWQNDAGPKLGWNDLDSLEVGTGTTGSVPSGLTDDERQSMMTFWSIANAPLYIGDDLTKIDEFGFSLLTNDEVIRINQSGYPGKQVAGGNTPVWAAKAANGSYYVALFNLNDSASAATVNWNDLGFSEPAFVADIWRKKPLGNFAVGFTAVLNPHASALLRVRPHEQDQDE